MELVNKVDTNCKFIGLLHLGVRNSFQIVSDYRKLLASESDCPIMSDLRLILLSPWLRIGYVLCLTVWPHPTIQITSAGGNCRPKCNHLPFRPKV